MTQEEKELLIRDLCGRLTYGVICTDLRHGDSKITEVNIEDGLVYCPDFDEYVKVENCHLYLRPMSSMTEEEKNIIRHKFCFGWNYEEEDVWNFLNHHMIYAVDAELLVDFCNAHHFDYRTDPFTGKTLIESGLAIEAPKGMYEIK